MATSINMYIAVRDLNEDATRRGEIININRITRRIELIPQFGGRVPSAVNSNTSLELDDLSYCVNSFTDKEIFQAVF